MGDLLPNHSLNYATAQETPAHYRSELVSYNKIRAQRTQMLHGDVANNADGVDENQEGDGYECCWQAPNSALAR